MEISVTIPNLPDTNNPKVTNWMHTLKNSFDNIDEDTYFIGHSLGCSAILRFLKDLPKNNKSWRSYSY